MTLMADKLAKAKEEIEVSLRGMLRHYYDDNDELFFVMENGTVFHVYILEELEAIVAEHADSVEDAEKNLLENGDLFFLNEMDADEITEKILEEAEQE